MARARMADDLEVPVHVHNTLVVGAGAAGMNAAVHLYHFLRDRGVPNPEERIAVVTRGLSLGASRMSGSDKQTYYKAGTSPRVADTAQEFARTLTAHGCTHGDVALAEALNSLREFYHLVHIGVPFPHDPEGAYIGYKTDHDPYERATSAGPKTSRFMSECLEREVRRCGIPILDKREVIHLLVREEGGEKRIFGMVAIDRSRLEDHNGLELFGFENLILAAGGPGEMYHTSVYPPGQIGIHGVAFRAGLRAHNLTESQFGMASISFRWNVSGSYMQVIPRVFSTDQNGGDPREFLGEYFPSMSRLATATFLKGYQWPFDPERIANHGSSLIDMAVDVEREARRRRVFLDFTRNPVPGPGMDPFRLDDLEPEALDYLRRTGSLQDLPIERLRHMNPPAIEIYREHGIDLEKDPLEIAVCAQHNNGGFAVDKWWETNIRRTFCIGEMAGTHGVKRPGGSALNSGQVGGLRAAEYIAHVYPLDVPDREEFLRRAQVAADGLLHRIRARLRSGEAAPASAREALTEIQARVTRAGAQKRCLSAVRTAVADGWRQLRSIREKGLRVRKPRDLIDVIQAEDMCLTHLAYLTAIESLLAGGGGSRCSYAVLAGEEESTGAVVHPKLFRPDTGEPLRLVPENKALRESVQEIYYDGARDSFETQVVPVRPIPERDVAFEPAWEDFREDRIYTM